MSNATVRFNLNCSSLGQPPLDKRYPTKTGLKAPPKVANPFANPFIIPAYSFDKSIGLAADAEPRIPPGEMAKHKMITRDVVLGECCKNIKAPVAKDAAIN